MKPDALNNVDIPIVDGKAGNVMLLRGILLAIGRPSPRRRIRQLRFR